MPIDTSTVTLAKYASHNDYIVLCRARFGVPAEVEDESMSDPQAEDTTIYKVVVNHEEQYSIWPADRKNAPGWNDEGTTGLKDECLAHIDKVWTDMRPLSLRKQMEGQGGGK
jgi:MbtH protein